MELEVKGDEVGLLEMDHNEGMEEKVGMYANETVKHGFET